MVTHPVTQPGQATEPGCAEFSQDSGQKQRRKQAPDPDAQKRGNLRIYSSRSKSYPEAARSRGLTSPKLVLIAGGRK